MDTLYISARMTLEFENMTLPELKATLAKYHLETTGKRADLVARLSNHFKKNGEEKQKVTTKNNKTTPKTSPKIEPKATTKTQPRSSSKSSQGSLNQSSPKSATEEPKSPTNTLILEPTSKKNPLTMTMEERLALRAKRFNLETKVKGNQRLRLVLQEDPELLKKRSERFGIPLVKPENQSQNLNTKKKIEFVVDEEELQRRKKRLERFGS